MLYKYIMSVDVSVYIIYYYLWKTLNYTLGEYKNYKL
jgi:hypothetical protein